MSGARTGTRVEEPRRPKAPVSEIVRLYRTGEFPGAEQAARNALARDANDYDAVLVLGLLALRRDRELEAQNAFKRAAAINPTRGEAYLQMALRHWRRGQLDDAHRLLRTAVTRDPGFSEAQFHLGNLLREAGRMPEAIEAYSAAINSDPENAEALTNLAGLLRDAGRTREALYSYEEAVRLRPDLSEAWFSLGALLLDLERFDGAVDAYTKSLHLNPKQADAHYWLGMALSGRGEVEAADQAYREAIRLDPRSLEARWALTMTQINPIPETVAVADESRARFAAELAELDKRCRARKPAADYNVVGSRQPFYLAYQEHSNRELLTQYGRLCAETMGPWQKKSRIVAAPAVRRSKRRIGIVSAHVRHHPVWNAIVRGWVANLDRSAVETYIFHTGIHEDRESDFARRKAAGFHAGKRDWSEWAEAIAGSDLDMLIYPEIGMDPTTAKLAALRLAPVQVASWGHPETTGLPTIDHFVSAEGMEPGDAQDHYSERLVLLPRLGCCYRRMGTRATPVDLKDLGIPPGARILLCAGTPYKYAPQFDRLLVDIARRAAPCRLVFFRHQFDKLSHQLEQRLRKVFDESGMDFSSSIVFVPWQSPEAFFGLLGQADVFLDTAGFSGFNTAMQAVECGLPIVAYEGAFLRGRFASGILRRMQMDEWVATSHESYVDKVVQLSSDEKLLNAARKQLAARREILFDDVEGVLTMQDWILGTAR